MPSWRRLGQAGLLVFALYLILSLLLTYPLLLHFTTHVVGSNIDEGTFIWNLWWVKHAVVDLHTSPLYTDQIFYPVGMSLVFYTLTLFNGLATIPLLFFVSPITANNVVLILSLTLSACGAYMLVKYLLIGQAEFVREPGGEVVLGAGRVCAPVPNQAPETGAPPDGLPPLVVHLAAFIGGLVYAFPASRFVYASLGQANLTSTAWLPFFVLYLLKTVRAARSGQGPRIVLPLIPVRYQKAWAWYGLWAGVFLLFAVLTELTYGAFLGLFAVTYLVFALKQPSWSKAGLVRLAGGLSIIGAVFLAGFSPVLVPALQQSAAGYVDDRWGGADQFSADLLSFAIPSRLHPVFGQQATEWSAEMTDLPIVFLGFSVSALALLAVLRYRRRLVFWWLSALGYLILSLGPVLHINGVSQFNLDGLNVRFALPFVILHYLPLIKANRVPNRFSILSTLCLAVLVGFAALWLLGKLDLKFARSWISTLAAAAISGVILFEHLATPLPLTYAAAPSVYEQIGQDKGDFAILQLPLGWRNSYGIQGAEKTLLESYQAVHGKRILGGNTSRNPEFKFRYFAEVPLFRSIIALEEGRPLDDGALEGDRDLAPSILTFYDLRYLVVHRDLVDPAVERYVLAVLPAEKFYEEGNVVAYRLTSPPRPTSGSIDLGTPSAAANRGEGWGGDETAAGGLTINWAVAKRTSLYFALPEATGTRLTLRMAPFIYAGMPDQTMDVVVNGRRIEQITLQAAWHDYSLEVPAADLHAGINQLEMDFAQIASPSKVLDSTDRRELAAAVDLVQWEADR